MLVKAMPGVWVPIERSRDRIGETPVEVPDTHYYRRQVMDGDLVVVKVLRGAVGLTAAPIIALQSKELANGD